MQNAWAMRLSILSFAAGVLLLQTLAELPGKSLVGWLLAFAVFVFLLARWRGGRVLACLSPIAWAIIGFAWAGILAHHRLGDALPEDWEARDIALVGVVSSLPQRFDRGERFEFDVETVLSPGATVPSHILLSWYRTWDEMDEAEKVSDSDSARTIHPGERWQFTVRLKRPHGNANPHGFDYEVWLLERNIRATGTIRSRQPMRRLDEKSWNPAYVVQSQRERLRERFLAVLPEAPYRGVLTALAIGDQRGIPAEQWRIFNRTGVTHLISISGLHVTMLAALCAAGIGGAWRRSVRLMHWLAAQKAAVIGGWLAALGYALLAGFEVPAQRTLYMLSVVAFALMSGRNFGASRTLAVALFIVLLLDPWAVLATGFWLSFGAVALLFFAGSARLGQAGDWRGRLRQWGLAQWAVTIGSLPLLLFFFQQFSLVSPLANMVAIPFVSLLVTPLALIFSLLPWPPLLLLDHWLMAQLMTLLEWLSRYPVWQQAAPPAWASLLALVGVVWLLLPRGFPSRWPGGCLLLPALFALPPRPLPGEAWVDVLDVGQGTSVVVRTAGHTLVYDTGPAYGPETNAAQRVLLPFLRAAGVMSLDVLLVSHRDKDHSGGMQTVRDELPIGRFVSSIAGVGAEPCVAGQNWTWENVHFEMLYPPPGDSLREDKKTNSQSCVLRVSTATGSVLLTGDIEAADESALIGVAPQSLPSEVLIVPHHGGRASSSMPFVEAVGAQDAVFSVGYRNAFRHPHPQVLERYATSHLWRTDRDGALRVHLARPLRVSAWRDEHKRYWFGR